MNYLIAKTAYELDICLRLLYAEKVDFTVKVIEKEDYKIEYHIHVNLVGDAFEKLNLKYKTISEVDDPDVDDIDNEDLED